MPDCKDQIEKFVGGKHLKLEDYQWFFRELFNGSFTEAQISCLLTSLRIHGETSESLIAGAQEMRARASKPIIKTSRPELTDNCGTGGDGKASFNISTAAALVASSLGIKMAKHGNRSVSSKCGSADLLFACGYPDSLNIEQSLKLLEEFNFTFFFAPNFHPAMKYVMPVRNQLKIRTIFNLLGPLANPIEPENQLLGVSERRFIRPMAEALSKLKVKKAYVVHSRDGMDELSPCEITDGIWIENGVLTEKVFDPKSLNLQSNPDELIGGDAKTNRQLLERLLTGEHNAILDAVALNAGAILLLNGRGKSIEEGFAIAVQKLKSGQVGEYFGSLIARTKEL